MSALEDEIDANQAKFFASWTTAAADNWSVLAKSGSKNYRESYRRVACLNGIRTTLVEPSASSQSAAFFLEAQNDLSRLGFSELAKYLSIHPATAGKTSTKNALELIESEYSTLSKAVHSSAESFRMTAGSETTLLWSTETPRLNMWSTRERRVMEGIAVLVVGHYAKELEGARNIGLREVLSFAIPSSKRTAIKADYKVTIRDA
jgi:hypothetical protein